MERPIDKIAIEKCGFNLPDEARYEYLLNLPKEEDLAKKFNHAMELIETYTPELADTLPKDIYYSVNSEDDPLVLSKLLRNFKDISADVQQDIFGEIYEYFLGKFALAEGQGGGEFFTPSTVVRYMVEVLAPTEGKILDPACGSGSLLLKVERVLGKENIERGFFGQEIDLTTYNLFRINMFLHNIEFDRFSIVREDTLISPMHWDDQPFELIVSNHPSLSRGGGDKNPLLINDPRFSPAGVLAPASKGDMAFIMHRLSWLANNDAAAIVCFPGIMYRGGAEQKIRKYLLNNNYVDAIIQLPSNLFLNVTISVDIMLLRKNKTDNTILFVDASGEFVKVTKNNRLSEENISRDGFRGSLT